MRDRNSNVISASEIGQYEYCSIGWFLQRKGYEPNSPDLKKGLEKHRELGEIINKTEVSQKKSDVFAKIGYMLFVIAALIIILEVI